MNQRALRDYIFIKKGKLRKEVLISLDKPITAKELAKKLNKHRSSISRILIGFEKVGITKCINKQDDKFRHYILTKTGEQLRNEILKVDL